MQYANTPEDLRPAGWPPHSELLTELHDALAAAGQPSPLQR